MPLNNLNYQIVTKFAVLTLKGNKFFLEKTKPGKKLWGFIFDILIANDLKNKFLWSSFV